MRAFRPSLGWGWAESQVAPALFSWADPLRLGLGSFRIVAVCASSGLRAI